ncbi:MAG: hypothetical protein QGG54_01165 [Gammaproteobacteria bacterium]|jgi:hypothetical protein|nr:hypothetical protein [Gammaproteobacteria bacterium]|tara:strand:+ start:4280 stop:5065 length:786 start_codon:yes stop_codon:yes gene_type:complete
MNENEELRLELIMERAFIKAMKTLIAEGDGNTIGELGESDALKVEGQIDEKIELLGDKGLNEPVELPVELTETVVKAEVAAEAAADAVIEAGAAPPPLPPPSGTQQMADLQGQLQMMNNVNGFPPKPCVRCQTVMHYSDLVSGYTCPEHGLNPKPNLLQRILGGTQDISTAAVATTGALAGASMGMMGAAMQTQAQMAQMGQMAASGAPPTLPAPGTEVTCPDCTKPAQDMSAYGGDYAGKYYCNGCKKWVEPVQPSATVG